MVVILRHTDLNHLYYRKRTRSQLSDHPHRNRKRGAGRKRQTLELLLRNDQYPARRNHRLAVEILRISGVESTLLFSVTGDRTDLMEPKPDPGGNGNGNFDPHFNTDQADVVRYRDDRRHRGALFKGNHPFLDASATIIQVVGVILMASRHVDQWLWWISAALVSLVLWSFAFLHHGAGLSLVIMWAAYLSNAIYGLVRWMKMYRTSQPVLKTT